MKPESCLLCVHLPHWPIDRLRRRQPALRHEPLVLFDTSNTRQVITAVSPQVPAHVQPGMTLAQALAYDATLQHAPANLPQDQRALEALGRWMMRFSPNVALDPPASLILDATGLDRLFGDVAALARRIRDELAHLQIAAGVAAAPTPGAAWALAAWGAGDAGHPVAAGGPDAILRALGPLPPEALRLNPALTQQLRGLGLDTVQLLVAVPRLQLVRRFGPEMLRHIDQTLGREKFQPPPWLPHRTPVVAEVEFDGAVESLEVIQLALRQLLEQIAAELTHRQQGARELRLLFRRPYAPPVEKSVHLTRPSRDPVAMFKLLEVASESLETEDGFISIQLSVPRSQRLGHRQRVLVGDEAEDRSAAVDHLIERLAARLENGIEWAEPVEAYVPEKAFSCAGHPTPTPRRENSKSTHDSKSIRRATLQNGPPSREPANIGGSEVEFRICDFPTRPLTLLRLPREIAVTLRPSDRADGKPVAFTDQGQVHRLSTVAGPERIAGQWWNGHWKTRDYYDVQDESGRRHWLFCVAETRRWFLHGLFE